MMANKILDHIEHVILGRRPKPLRTADFEIRYAVDAPDISPTLDVNLAIEAQLKVFFRQIVPENAPPEHKQLIKERAKAAIARHLYGDVVDSLSDIKEALWEEGYLDGDAGKKLHVLLHELRGTMGAFE